MNITLLILSILPIYIIGSWIYKKDRNKEPSNLLTKLFCAGIMATFITSLISNLLEKIAPITKTNIAEIYLLSLPEQIYIVFIGIALVEELSKWLMIYLSSYNHKEFEEPFDIILYATFVALGFACVENILYVSEYGTIAGITRALSAVPGHACDGMIMGYYLGLAKQYQLQKNHVKQNKYLLLSLIFPTIVHGIYDILLLQQNIITTIIFVIYIIILFCFWFSKARKIAKTSKPWIKKNKFCPQCGTPIQNHYCPKCGHPQDKTDTQQQVEYNPEVKEIYLKAWIQEQYEPFKKKGISGWTILFGTNYLLYRKMYGIAIFLFVVSIISERLLPKTLNVIVYFLVTIAIASNFKEAYIETIKDKIKEIIKQNPNKSEEEIKMICEKKGGTSILPVIIFLLSVSSITLLLMLIIFYT